MNYNNMNKDNFSEIIKNKLQNYSLSIEEEDAWNKLEERLNKKSGNKIVLWPWISGVSVAASIALIGLIFSLNKQVVYENTADQLPDNEETIAKRVFTEEVVSLERSSSSQILPVFVRKNTSAEGGIAGRLDVPGPDITDTEEAPVTAENSKSKKKQLEELDFSEELASKITCLMRKKTTGFGIHVGSGGNLYAMNNNSSLNNLHSELRTTGFSAVSSKNSTALPFNEYSKIIHRPPVSFGLSVRKELNNWLSIESGLTYTYLYSKFENNIPSLDAKSELHYLGVPVNLVASLHSGSYKKWNIYVSAGGMVEKGLLSHYLRNEYDTGVVVSTSSNEKIDGLQWSLQAAIGIDYKIHKTYSVYFEPKLNYYLDNNQPYNSRTDHPFVVGLNAGIRYTW
jgi:hypothetical protein